MLTGLLALVAAALFTGAAFYVNFAEQHARLQLDDRALLAEWQPSYKRGAIMQASLALIAFLLAGLTWWQDGRPAMLIGGLIILTAWPWTLLVIKPVNGALQKTSIDSANAQTRASIQRWGRLHAVRTALGAVATGVILYSLLSIS